MQNSQPGPQPVEIYIANLVSGAAPKSEPIKVLLSKLEVADGKLSNLQQSLNQARSSLKSMEAEHLKTVGSMETLIGLIQESAPKDEFEKYSKEVLNAEVNGDRQ